MQITHITKEDFFDAFVEAFYASITANNIQAGFRAAGLVPFDPESVVSRLDPKPITPSPPSSRPGTATSWVPKTPSNAYEAGQSSSTLKRKIENHQGSSPTHIFDVIDLQAKSISKLAHEITSATPLWATLAFGPTVAYTTLTAHRPSNTQLFHQF